MFIQFVARPFHSRFASHEGGETLVQRMNNGCKEGMWLLRHQTWMPPKKAQRTLVLWLFSPLALVSPGLGALYLVLCAREVCLRPRLSIRQNIGLKSTCFHRRPSERRLEEIVVDDFSNHTLFISTPFIIRHRHQRLVRRTTAECRCLQSRALSSRKIPRHDVYAMRLN